MLDEPGGDAGDVRTEPHPVGEGPRVDAAVDLATPVRQILVVPAAIGCQELDGAALTQDRGVQAPLPQCAEGPRRCRPGLAVFCFGAVKVEVPGEERAAGPLPVIVLQGEQTRAEAFRRNARACRFPDLWRFAREVALDLPAQCRVRIQEPL